MLSAPESCGSTFANVTPLASGVMRSKSGGVDARSRQLAEAEQEFKTVISLAPKDASGHANLGLTYLRANRLAEAESELKRARKLDARSPEVALILARLYVLTRRPDDATRALATIEPDARVLYMLAQIDRQTSGDTVYSARLRQ